MQQYNLKDKIKITAEFLDGLLSKSWQEVEMLQHQITNIDTNAQFGSEVSQLLKNMCTSYYVLIGCLENLAENEKSITADTDVIDSEALLDINVPGAEIFSEPIPSAADANENTDLTINDNFEPFEYFVDFEEPSGEPLSDQDLYG